jgi:hypothetical protein
MKLIQARAQGPTEYLVSHGATVPLIRGEATTRLVTIFCCSWPGPSKEKGRGELPSTDSIAQNDGHENSKLWPRQDWRTEEGLWGWTEPNFALVFEFSPSQMIVFVFLGCWEGQEKGQVADNIVMASLLSNTFKKWSDNCLTIAGLPLGFRKSVFEPSQGRSTRVGKFGMN